MTNVRVAQLWAGLVFATLTLAGCPSPGPGPGDGNVNCNSALCLGDGGMDATDGGNTSCTPVAENCFDGIDNDCDHYVDANDTDCGSSCTPVAENTQSCLTNVDNDCDHQAGSADSDCAMPICHPGTTYGVDSYDDVHGASMTYCFNFSWSSDLTSDASGTMAQVLGRPGNFSCCPVGGGACVSRDMAYNPPGANGLEPSVRWNNMVGSFYGSEAGPSGERLLVNRPMGTFIRVLDDGKLENGTISGNTRTVTENCQ